MNAHTNRKPIGQAHHARKAIATTATGAIVAALIVGLLTAWYKGDLFVVALSCCAAVFVTGLIL